MRVEMHTEAAERNYVIALLRRWSWVRAPALSPSKPNKNTGSTHTFQNTTQTLSGKSDTKVILFSGALCDSLQWILFAALILFLGWLLPLPRHKLKFSFLRLEPRV